MVDSVNLAGGIPTPLKNDGVRQLGPFFIFPFPTYGSSHNPFHGSSHHQPAISLTIINHY
jgi:hypothetical protein